MRYLSSLLAALAIALASAAIPASAQTICENPGFKTSQRIDHTANTITFTFEVSEQGNYIRGVHFPAGQNVVVSHWTNENRSVPFDSVIDLAGGQTTYKTVVTAQAVKADEPSSLIYRVDTRCGDQHGSFSYLFH